MSTATPPLALSGTPKATIAVGCVAALAVAITAVASAGATNRAHSAPILLAAAVAPAVEAAAAGDARTAVIYSADGRSRITITVEPVETVPASSPHVPTDFTPETDVRHAAARP